MSRSEEILDRLFFTTAKAATRRCYLFNTHAIRQHIAISKRRNIVDMKNYLFLFALVFSACAQPESNSNKYEQGIKDWISKNINDPSSYESIEFGPLDTVYGITDKEYADYLSDSVTWYADYLIQEMERQNDSMNGKASKPKADRPATPTRPRNHFIGYKMRHKFRGKNGMGALMVNEQFFYMDSIGAVYKVNTAVEEMKEQAAEIVNDLENLDTAALRKSLEESLKK